MISFVTFMWTSGWHTHTHTHKTKQIQNTNGNQNQKCCAKMWFKNKFIGEACTLHTIKRRKNLMSWLSWHLWRSAQLLSCWCCCCRRVTSKPRVDKLCGYCCHCRCDQLVLLLCNNFIKTLTHTQTLCVYICRFVTKVTRVDWLFFGATCCWAISHTLSTFSRSLLEQFVFCFLCFWLLSHFLLSCLPLPFLCVYGFLLLANPNALKVSDPLKSWNVKVMFVIGQSLSVVRRSVRRLLTFDPAFVKVGNGLTLANGLYILIRCWHSVALDMWTLLTLTLCLTFGQTYKHLYFCVHEHIRNWFLICNYCTFSRLCGCYVKFRYIIYVQMHIYR